MDELNAGGFAAPGGPVPGLDPPPDGGQARGPMPAGGAIEPRRSLYLAWGLALLSITGALTLTVVGAVGHQIDFDIYRMGAANVAGHLYGVRLSRALMGGSPGMEFTYPPFAALLFFAFAHLPVSAGQLSWSLLNLLALAAIIAVSVRALRPGWPPRRVWTVVATALLPALLLNPDSLTMSYGQINFWVMLLALLDLTGTDWPGSRKMPRGVLLGAAAAIKLTPLIFIPFLCLTRQLRAGLTALASFLACSLAALAIAPRSSWLYWTREIFDARRAGNRLYISDQNLRSALIRVTGSTPSHLELGALSVLCGVAGLAVAAWAYRVSSPMLGILACAATGLIISPISWAHHYVWIVPVLAWLALGPDRPAGGHWWALGVALLFWAAPIWWVSDPQSGFGGPLTLVAGNSFFLAAVALVIAACVLPLSRRARGT